MPRRSQGLGEGKPLESYSAHFFRFDIKVLQSW